jgi:hypothetical protein
MLVDVVVCSCPANPAQPARVAAIAATVSSSLSAGVLRGCWRLVVVIFVVLLIIVMLVFVVLLIIVMLVFVVA